MCSCNSTVGGGAGQSRAALPLLAIGVREAAGDFSGLILASHTCARCCWLVANFSLHTLVCTDCIADMEAFVVLHLPGEAIVRFPAESALDVRPRAGLL